MVADQKYDLGGGGWGERLEAADYPREVSACEGQELGGLKPPLAPPGSATLGTED